MKSLFLESILHGVMYVLVSLVSLNLELKQGFIFILGLIISRMIIMESKIDDILESRKTDNYSNGVGIK